MILFSLCHYTQTSLGQLWITQSAFVFTRQMLRRKHTDNVKDIAFLLCVMYFDFFLKRSTPKDEQLR